AVRLLHEHVGREDVEALLLPLCHHEPLRQSVPELGRKDQPPLVFELRGGGAHKEHRAPPRFLLDPPLSPTIPHFTPPSTTNHHYAPSLSSPVRTPSAGEPMPNRDRGK